MFVWDSQRHNALQESEIGFTVNLPECEVEQLWSGVIWNSKCVIQALTDIQAEKAEAKVESDRNLIFDVIKESELGFLTINKQV